MSPQHNNLTLSQAIDGMILEKRADGKSTHTIADYHVTFKKLQCFLGDDLPLVAITREQLISFFVWLRDEYVSEPDGVAPRGQIKLSDKTRRNIHTNLSALWTWAANNNHITQNIVRTIDAPAIKPPVIDPFTKDEIAALIKACDKTRTWKSREAITSGRPTAERDKLIVCLLFDTGVRAQELCDITLADLNLSTNTIRVRKGKGEKDRIVRFGKRTAKMLWAYLVPRLSGSKPTDALILADQHDPRPMNRNALGWLLRRLGRRAGVAHVHPHRFRHSFATNYLRNGGDLRALKDLLGHSDLEMVMRYAHFVEADVAVDYEGASPVDNWRL